MSNGWKLELGTWGDGSIRLAFWDSARGVGDQIYILNVDGTADKHEFVNDDLNDFTAKLTRVELVTELRALLARLDATQ